jgi:hypothetical protein
MAKEIRTTSSSGGQKGTKLQAYDKIPANPIKELAQLYSKGAGKYLPRNWERAYEYSKSFASFMRHLQLFMGGENYDLELGSNHLANVAWHCVAIYTFTQTHPEFDDRPTIHKENIIQGRQTIIDTKYPITHSDLESYKRKEGENEPRYDLIPLAPLARLAELYGSDLAHPVANNPHLLSDYYARLMEHSWTFWSGEDYDSNGIHHMIWSLHYVMCMMDLFERYPAYDDRFTPEFGAQPIGFNSMPETDQ